jgi:hypothetical protein
VYSQTMTTEGASRRLDAAAKAADRMGQDADAQWLRDRAQAIRDGKPEPAGPTVEERIRNRQQGR